MVQIGPALPDSEYLRAKGTHENVVISGDVSNDDQGSQELTHTSTTGRIRLKTTWPEGFLTRGYGLGNLGNSCYLNSVLQCLTYLPPVANLASDRGFHRHDCKLGLNNCSYCMLFSRLMNNVKPDLGSLGLKPTRLYNNLPALSDGQLRKGRQEDAHELLSLLLASCERDLLKCEGRWNPHKHIPNPDTAVNLLFQGTLRSQVRCRHCHHESNTYEACMDLSLELPPSALSLADALSTFTASECLDGANRYRCDACRNLVPADKQLTLHHPPNCLVIHLKRFSSDHSKISRHISFPESLSLHTYASQPTPPDPSILSYTLHGVVVHSGYTRHSGHYYSYIRTSDPDPAWYCMNDSSVSRASLSEVRSQQAYLLFYVCTRMHPLKPVPPPSEPPTAPSAASSSASNPAITANGAATPSALQRAASHPAANGRGHSPPSPRIPPAAATFPSTSNGNGTHKPQPAAQQARAGVTHFGPPPRSGAGAGAAAASPRTKQGIAEQHGAAKPPVPPAVLRLTLQPRQPEEPPVVLGPRQAGATSPASPVLEDQPPAAYSHTPGSPGCPGILRHSSQARPDRTIPSKAADDAYTEYRTQMSRQEVGDGGKQEEGGHAEGLGPLGPEAAPVGATQVPGGMRVDGEGEGPSSGQKRKREEEQVQPMDEEEKAGVKRRLLEALRWWRGLVSWVR